MQQSQAVQQAQKAAQQVGWSPCDPETLLEYIQQQELPRIAQGQPAQDPTAIVEAFERFGHLTRALNGGFTTVGTGFAGSRSGPG